MAAMRPLPLRFWDHVCFIEPLGTFQSTIIVGADNMTSAAYLQGHLGRDLYQGLGMPGTWKGLNTFKNECCILPTHTNALTPCGPSLITSITHIL